MHGKVGLIGAMHAKHSQKMRVRRRQCAKPHQCQCRRPARQMRQLGQQLRRAGAGIDDAATAIDYMPLGAFHRGNSRLDSIGSGLSHRLIARNRLRTDALTHIGDLGHQNVLWQINQHRPGTSRGGNMKRLDYGLLELRPFLDQIIMLCTGTGDASRVSLLKSIIANQMRRHLTGETDNGNGIHQSVSKTSHRIGCARTGRDQHDTCLAG